MIIAIDGPAASGKGTLGRTLATHFGLRHLDTGLLYRAVAKALLNAGRKLDDIPSALAATRALRPEQLDDPTLKSHAIGDATSVVAAIPEVRTALLQFQRDFAQQPPGAVLDGRDIGTVVCPNADVKIFVTASARERARRRVLELQTRGEIALEQEVLADILRRDERDSSRAVAPLLPASDAYILDTTNMDIDAVLNAAMAIIQQRR